MKRRNVILAAIVGFVFIFLARLQQHGWNYSQNQIRQEPEDDDGDTEFDDSYDEEDESRWPRKDGKRISQILAEEKIAAVNEQLGSGRGPIIVGGIGDSGTRGFWDVLMKLGVYMQGQLNVRGDSRDSFAFMAKRTTTLSDGTPLLRSPSALYNEPIGRSRSIKYNSSFVRPERWQAGRQYVADMIQQVINDTIARKSEAGKKSVLYPFGFKHPRTALLVPYFVATLGSAFAFIHVVRDDREVSHGDNNYLFLDHCKSYYGIDKCDSWRAIEMWADLNREVFEYALESPMSANQYFAMRVEDLVQGQSSCYENLVKFLDIPPFEVSGVNITERMQKAMTGSMTHSKSYFGQKYSYNERLQMQNVKSKKARDALKFWGYSETKFGLSVDCTEMPWMAEFRKRKGKLPTDA